MSSAELVKQWIQEEADRINEIQNDFESWFEDVQMIMSTVYGHSVCITEQDDWFQSFEDGLTPEDAVEEDMLSGGVE
jgi:hypothetical protein